MRLKEAAVKLARLVLPSSLLVRHPSDDDERRSNYRAAVRAHRAVDQWQEAMRLQRALHFEQDFWRRHGHG